MPLASAECRWAPSPPPCCSQDAEGFPIDIKVKDNGDGTFHCVYVPTKAMKHTVIVAWGGVNTPNSPFRVGVMGARGCWGGRGGPLRCGEGVLFMEGVQVSDVGHGSPMGLGAHGMMWMEMGVPWGAGCGDGGATPIGCWGRAGGSHEVLGMGVYGVVGGGVPVVGGLEVPAHGVPGKEGSVPLPHETLWARR